MVQPRRVDDERRRPARTRDRSASQPTLDPPLRSSPTSRRGAAAIHRTTSAQRVAARRASVQTAGSPTCSEEMPPHAVPKSPLSSRFSSGVHGEWSDTTQSMLPSASACPQQVAVVGLADRRAALELGGAVGDLLRVEDQVVRAGLDGDADPVARAGAQHRHARRSWTGAGCAPRPPVRRAASMTCAIGDVLRAARPGGEERRRTCRPCGGGGCSMRVGVLGVHDHQRRRSDASSRQVRPRARPASAAGTRPPRSRQEALEAEHARLVQPAQVVDVAGDRAAPEADVDVRLSGRGLPLDLAAPSTVVVGGRLLSGMSMIVVTPPAAAARVAVAKPSHSVRPGSLTCTWVSTRPGSSTSSSARSTVSRAASSPRRAARSRR